jgi:hypothetical protein
MGRGARVVRPGLAQGKNHEFVGPDTLSCLGPLAQPRARKCQEGSVASVRVVDRHQVKRRNALEVGRVHGEQW